MASLKRCPDTNHSRRWDGRPTRNSPQFSSVFHREVSSSTVSAQVGGVFLLRTATICRRVGGSENVEFLSLLNDRGRASGSWRFSRVNRRGTFRTRAQARSGCPGMRPPPLPLLGAGRAAGQPQRLRARDRKITDRQPALANAALRVSAVGLRRSFRRPAVTKAGQESTCNAVGVAGLGRICVLGARKKSPTV